MAATKKELELEIASLRRHIAALESAGVEVKRTQQALTESEQRYRLLADNVTDVIWSADQDLRFTYFSPSVFQQRGYTVQEGKEQPLG